MSCLWKYFFKRRKWKQKRFLFKINKTEFQIGVKSENKDRQENKQLYTNSENKKYFNKNVKDYFIFFFYQNKYCKEKVRKKEERIFFGYDSFNKYGICFWYDNNIFFDDNKNTNHFENLISTMNDEKRGTFLWSGNAWSIFKIENIDVIGVIMNNKGKYGSGRNGNLVTANGMVDNGGKNVYGEVVIAIRGKRGHDENGGINRIWNFDRLGIHDSNNNQED